MSLIKKPVPSELLSESAERYQLVFFTFLGNTKLQLGALKSARISDQLEITNNTFKINKIIKPRYKEDLGNLNYEALKNTKALVYSIEQVNSPVNTADHARYKMHALRQCLATAWLFKSHAANADTGYAVLYKNNEHVISSIPSPIPISHADGSTRETIFKKTDFMLMRSENSGGLDLIRKNDSKIRDGFTHFVKENSKDNNRINICRIHISHAMQMIDIGMKISIYCSALESLFSTQFSEIIHQVAERVAMFMTQDSDERMEIYANIKKIYSSRSKYVHGNSFKKTEVGSLKEQSLYVDQVLRAVLFRLLKNEDLFEIFSGNNDDLDKYFRKMIMGGDMPDSQY